MRVSTVSRARRHPVVIEKGYRQRRHKPDYWLLIISTVLLAIGLVVIYSIGPGLAIDSQVSQNYYINRQMIAVGLGIIGFIIAAGLPTKVWYSLQKPLLVLAAISAIAVRLFGQSVLGAYRWIQIGGFSFQSSELIKFALLVWAAAFLSDRIHKGDITNARKTLRPLLIAMGVVVLVVAVIQSDLGSTAVMLGMVATMAFIAGMPLRKLITICAIILIAGVLAISTSGYRRQRLLTYIHPTSNCQTTGYQACQALISVGSGGMIGLGLGRSVQAYGYLPEPADDSIFAIFGEKFGLIGSLILLGLFVALFNRIKRIVERAPDDFSRLLATGILAWLSIQAFINIGAMIGILPLKGITLPFISYGGTSILFVTAAIGVVFQISRYTSYNVPIAGGDVEGKNNENRRDRRGVRGAHNSYPSGRI